MKWMYAIASLLVLVSVSIAQEKPIPQRYVTDVLRARLIAVVSYSQAEPTNDQQANERARLDTEQALSRWDKYQVTGDASHADLILVVRKGRARSSTINSGSPHGAVLYPNDSGVTIGTHRGQPPPLSRSDPTPGQAQPRVGQEVGSPDDRLEVYLGITPRIDDATRTRTQYPLDEPPIWSYTAENGLNPPGMEAVAKFRKAVEAAQKKQP
jgi:hypothetical protein